MKKIFSVIIITSCIYTSGYCQEAEKITVRAKNAVYVELLGSGIAYSVNYERIFPNKITLRAGVGNTFGFEKHNIGDIFAIPVTSTYLKSMGEKSHLEIGIGGTYFHINETKGVFLSPLFGIREHDLENNGTVLRLNFIPVFQIGSTWSIFLTGGLSIGYAF